MADKILNAFDVWITAQGVKSAGRLRTVDNISIEGVIRLRHLILSLAMRGKLTEPRPNEFCATDNEIAVSKTSYYKSSKSKTKEYEFEPPLIDEFELPSTWKWKRVGELCDLQTGATPSTQKKEYYDGSIRWLVSGDINQGIIEECEGRISEEGLKNSNCKILPINTVLIALNGQGKTRATVALLKIPAACNQSLVGMIPFDSKIIDPRFLMLALKLRYYEIRDITGQKQRRGLNMGLVSNLSIPLAPIEQQHRIVAKVDELMALCDALEQQETEHLKSHRLLVETLLGTLTRAADAKEFQHAWKKLEAHFDDLFTTEDSIDQLKQTILQLAVMGKLVPQNPNDEPASELLKKIAKEKDRLVEEGKIKKQKEFPQLLTEDETLDLPNGWAWSSLSQVCQINPRNEAEENLEASFIPMSMVSTSHTGQHEFEIKKWGDIKSGFTHFADGDIGIAKITPCFENSKAILLSGLKNGIGAGTTELFIARPYGETINQRYILLYLKSPEYLRMGESHMTGTAGQKRLSRSFFEGNPLPLPPLNEQKRIVSKVDDLFALCDRLKERIAEAQKVANQMAEGVVMNH